MSLHYLQDLMDDLPHMLSEALTVLQPVNGFKDLNVQFDLLRVDSIGADA